MTSAHGPVFRSPDRVLTKSGLDRGRESVSVIFEGAVARSPVDEGSLHALLGELECRSGRFSFGPVDFSVSAENQDLIVRCAGNPHKEIDYLKYLILKKLRRHEADRLEARELAIRLMEITNSDELLLSALETTLLSEDLPGRREELRTGLRENAGHWVEAVASVYNKYYTREELLELIGFYQSDTGRKTLRVMPELGQEITQLVRAWADAYIRAAG